MSVLRIIWLDCNGCDDERFVPEKPSVYSLDVRKQAEAAGWLVNHKNQSKDYGPRCAAAATRTAQARGVCRGCNTEHVVTMSSVVKQHRVRNAYGGTSPCPGGGRAPRGEVRRATPRGRAWQSLV